MIIRHDLPSRNFTRIDRYVVTDTKLSDGAVRLYSFLCGLRNGADYTDAYLIKVLDISQTIVTRRKKELKDAGLILIDQITPRLYVIYIGHSKLSARKVKARWKEEEANTPPAKNLQEVAA